MAPHEESPAVLELWATPTARRLTVRDDDQPDLDQSRHARLAEQLQELKLLAAELQQRPHDLTLHRQPSIDKLTLAIHYLQQAVDALEPDSR